MAHNGSRIRPRFSRIAYIAAFFIVFSGVWLLSHLQGYMPSPWKLYRTHYLNGGWTTEDELRALACLTSVFPRRTLRSLDLTDGLVPYAFGMTIRRDAYQWRQQLRGIDVATPLMIYSKTYCPFSRRAKELFEQLDVQPRPVITEVDLREDADVVKDQLTRLTGRATFPNILLRSKSIGGFTDIQALYESGQLRKMLEDEGMTVRGG